jgi:uncharacterized membrane protein
MSSISAADGLLIAWSGVEFVRPSALWLLLLVIPVVLASARSRARLPRPRHRLALAVRLAGIVLLVLALGGLRWITRSDRLSVMFVIDRSLSVSASGRAWSADYVRQALSARRPGDTVGVVVFGRDAAIDVESAERSSVGAPSAVIDADGTDISRALSLAEAAFPQDQARRIVLLSDGAETHGDAQAEAGSAAERGVSIWTACPPRSEGREVLVDRVEAPAVPRKDEPFELRVTVKSSGATAAALLVKRNGIDVGRVPLTLHHGDNVFFVPQTLHEAGVYDWQVTVEAEGDTEPGNNTSSAVAAVEGPPRVLYLVGDDAQPGYVPAMLAAQGLAVDVATARHLPTSLVELERYASVVLANVSALAVSDRQMSLLASYVKDLGGGLVMIGGPDGFGAGGWYRTPVEDVLPVRMDIRKRKSLPTVGLALVIDKSGSMADMAGGLEKMALARESAIATLEMLGPYDWIGVIAFDEAAKWVVEMQPAKDPRAIAAQVASLRAGGGTALYPGLLEAYGALLEVKAPVRHAIVLSDGATAPGDFDGLLAKMRAAHITVSTVAIGQDADRPFMQKLARSGGGAAYYTDNASLLPRIITRDAVLSSHSALVEEPFIPRGGDPHPITRGLGGKVPALLGYDMTTAREHASVPLLTPQGDPLLAAWRSGLGKSVAFTSDDGRRWSGRWSGWSAAPGLFSQAVRWTISELEGGAIRLRARVDGATLRVTAETGPGESLEGVVLDGEGKRHPLALEQTGPGRFEGQLASAGPGGYMVRVRDPRNGDARKAGVVVSYSPELRRLEPDRFLLGRIAALSGGREQPSPSAVFAPPSEPVRVGRDGWPLLVLIAAALFPLDVALRRVFLPAGWWARMWTRSGQAVVESARGAQTLGALKAARRPRAAGMRPNGETPGAVLEARSGGRTEAPAPVPERTVEEAQGPRDVAGPPPSGSGVGPVRDASPGRGPRPEEGSVDTLAELRKARRERRRP